MLKRIKECIEKKINRPVSTTELKAALDDAKNNVACNFLLLGHDVTADDFMDILVNCIEVKKNLKENNANITVLAIVDQGGQLKYITRATIMDYNRTTVFGITPENKRTWLGNYDTPEDAEKVRDHINRQISESGEIIKIP